MLTPELAKARLNTKESPAMRAWREREALEESKVRAAQAVSDAAQAQPLHDLITARQETANAYRVVFRNYGGDIEATGMKLESGERLMRGGGAGRKHSSKEQMDELTLSKSKQRARSNLRRRCFSARMDRMLTLTFKENVTDLREAWQVFKYFSKLMKWRYRERWFYVAVPEFQSRGAVHFHLAINGYFHANTVRRFWHQAVGQRGGNIDITSPRNIGKASWNPRRIAQYLSKYISKNESVEFNQRRYSSGGDIPEPEVTRGWCAFGLCMSRLFRDLAYEFTRKALAVIWEADDQRGLIYCST